MGILFDSSYTYEVDVSVEYLRLKIEEINNQRWYEINLNMASRISNNNFVVRRKVSLFIPRGAVIEGNLIDGKGRVTMKIVVRPSYLMVGSFYVFGMFLIIKVADILLRGDWNTEDIGLSGVAMAAVLYIFISMRFSTRRLLKQFETYLGLHPD